MENQLVNAILLENNRIEVSYISDDINSVGFSLAMDDTFYPLDKIDVSNNGSIYRLILSPTFEMELGHIYKLKTSEEEETFVRLDTYVATQEFSNKYTYYGKLGIEYSKEETAFRLWSPLSEKVFLKLEKGENNFALLPMKRKEKFLSKRTTTDRSY